MDDQAGKSDKKSNSRKSSMESQSGKEGKDGQFGTIKARQTRQDKESCTGKGVKEGKAAQKSTTSKLKERWLLTRKTWRYMSDAGKKLFPEGVNPHKLEDIPKVEEHFQKISQSAKDFIMWPMCQAQESPSDNRHRTRLSSPLSDSTDTHEEEQETDEEVLGINTNRSSLPSITYPSYYHGATSSNRDRFLSAGDLLSNLPTDVYQHLAKNYGASILHHVAYRLLEERLTEEDEFDYEDDCEMIEIEGRPMRCIGAQTEPQLDICVQTEQEDITAEMQTQTDKPEELEPQTPAPQVKKKFWSRRESTAGPPKADIPHVIEKEKGLASEKDREAPPPKGGVAAKLAALEASKSSGGQAMGFGKTQPAKQQEKKGLKNVFKMGLRCDMDVKNSPKKGGSKNNAEDKFKTVNYDKSLRNITSKYVPGCSDDEETTESSTSKGKTTEIKKKGRGVQVGEPLPHFILARFRVNAPVQIINATKKRVRRISIKPESSDVSSSECSMSVPPTLPTSPRYSITISDEQGIRDVGVSEAEAVRITQMGASISFKRPSIDASVDTSEIEQGIRDGLMISSGPNLQRSIAALQASSHLSQALAGNTRGGRGPNIIGGGSSGTHRGSQGILQSLQRTMAAGSGHASRLVAKRLWRSRSKSQGRAGPTCIWTPMGGNTWMSVTGRVVTLDQTCLLHLCELERVTLQQLALTKLQALSLGCQVRIPKDVDGPVVSVNIDGESSKEATSTTPHKRRKPHLLKRKTFSATLVDTKKDNNKAKDTAVSGVVFGLSLNKCLENERLRSQEAGERMAVIAATTSCSSGGEEGDELSRKSSQTGSHTSFSSLIEGAKQSGTGSLESLNLERKRPSLVGGEILSPTTMTQDLLLIEMSPHVPGLVAKCFRHLQENGLRTLGIFRVSTSKKRVRQLRQDFDSGREVELNEDLCPHDVATLLKEFFRDLPEPLLTRELYDPLLHTQKIRNRRLQLEALQYLVQLLPTANRDTLHSLLNFLTTIAENSADLLNDTGESVQGNRMDSSNLATIFAPNILHCLKPGAPPPTPAELAVHAEERIDVINVVRSMIDHNKELFEISAELLDETFQHLMDSHPEALDVLLRRRCTGPDEHTQQYLQQLLASLLQPGRSHISPVTSPPPPHPTHTPASAAVDLEVDTNSSVFEGSEGSSSLPRSPTEHHIHDFDRRCILEDISIVQKTQKDKITVNNKTRKTPEDKSWFRRREKSSSQELEQNNEERQHSDRPKWFRRREKSGSRKSDDKELQRGVSNKIKNQMDKQLIDHRVAIEPSSSKVQDLKLRPHSTSDQPANQEHLRVPDSTYRRLSSPEIDVGGIITASLKIAVPLQEHGTSLDFAQDIPFIEESHHQEEVKTRRRGVVCTTVPRQRTGSNDSYLGQAITGSMSFQPLTKKDIDKESHDSVLSSSSADVFTLSPSPRNTPSSDFLYASGTSSPLSGAGSPPMWLSPDSGTPGLSPPGSPPPLLRRNRYDDDCTSRPIPITHSATHTYGTRPLSSRRVRERSSSRGSSTIISIGRSRTSDSVRLEQEMPPFIYPEDNSVIGRRNSKDEVTRQSRGVTRESTGRQYTRRKYTSERHPTGHLPDINSPLREDPMGSPTDSSAQLWKRWEIIASDPTEPETFV